MGWNRWARRVEVEPSLYAADFSRLGEQLGELAGAGARGLHFDVGDGHFIPEALDRIARLRSLLPDEMRVQVDGGVHAETIGPARAAGADLLVAGSAVFWNDAPAAAYRALVGAVSEPVRG